jgi:hypothetical protein
MSLGLQRDGSGGSSVGRIECKCIENTRTVVKFCDQSIFAITCPCHKLDESRMKELSQNSDGHSSREI